MYCIRYIVWRLIIVLWQLFLDADESSEELRCCFSRSQTDRILSQS